MIRLHGRTFATMLPAGPIPHLWVLSDAKEPRRPTDAYLVDSKEAPPTGFALYVVKRDAPPPADGNHIVLPPELDYLAPGDIIGVSPEGTRVDVLWRQASRQNSILLTEQCDNYCLMCSQPPKEGDDLWLLDRAADLVRLLPPETTDLGFTGGEPTLAGHRLLELLALTSDRVPNAGIHLLSNGRRFADLDFAANYAAIDNPRMMVGIPLYGAEASLHDFVVQARGAFNETVRGILNLARFDQSIELRIVVHRQTVPALIDIAEFITRNLPFVDQVALMGLEMMGLARGNVADVWVDPFEYRETLSEAALILDGAGLRTMIFNHQLCLLERRAWPFAVQSISDWKNEYDAVCDTCHVRNLCGGFFHSAKYKSSAHIRPIDEAGIPLFTRTVIPAIGGWQRRTPAAELLNEGVPAAAPRPTSSRTA